MSPRPLLAFAMIASTAVGGGCANRTDARTRAAFEAAQRGERAPTTDGRGRRNPQRRDPRRTSPTAWSGLDDRLADAIDLLAAGIDGDTLIATTGKWCAVTPEPSASETGPTYVCFTEPALNFERRSFILEVARTGVIGFEMRELSGPQSREIATRATDALAHHCARPFAKAVSTVGDEAEFSTCPVDGGSTLAIGHARATAEEWFVSVAVLGTLVAPKADPPPP